MALTLPSRLRILMALVCWLVLSCAPSQTQAPNRAAMFSINAPTKRTHSDAVVVFLPMDAAVEPVWIALRDELSPEMDTIPIPISKSSTIGDLAQAIVEYSPKCVVLIDNKTTNLYARYQASAPQQSFPPAVILLSSYAGIYENIRNATGIAYEVPLLLSTTRLRNFVGTPIERVGVVHRKALHRYVTGQAKLAKTEEIKVVAVQLPDDASPKDVATALSELTGRIDALWILNDNALLTPVHIEEGWLPALAKAPLLTIVGIPGLVTKDVRFGTFAVVPDLGALGVQAATLIYDLTGNSRQSPDNFHIEEPLSVRTVLDVRTARKHFNFNESTLGEISDVVQ
jgi:hypothetical protein